MGCCCPKPIVIVREVKLICIGLDNAGKTTILKLINGEDPRGVMSTNGFSKLEMKYNSRFDLTVYDLGGGARIRDIWDNYYAEVHAIIYVMNMSDADRYDEAYQCIEKEVTKTALLCLTNRHTASKPVLFILNNTENGDVDDVDFTNRAKLHEATVRAQHHPFVAHMHKMQTFVPFRSAPNIEKRCAKNPMPLLQTFAQFIDKTIEHYVAISEGVRQAEIMLQIRQQEAKEARRMRLMQQEHEARKQDIAQLEGRLSPTQGQGSSQQQQPVPVEQPIPAPRSSVQEEPIPVASPQSHSQKAGTSLSSDVFEPEPKQSARNKVAPTRNGSLPLSQPRDASIFSVSTTEMTDHLSTSMDNAIMFNDKNRQLSRIERIQMGVKYRAKVESIEIARSMV